MSSVSRLGPVTPRGRPQSARRPSWPGSPVAVGALCLLVALVFEAVLMHQTGLSGDEPYYERMATHPAGPHNFPYAFRIGIPYLVHVLPFSHAFSWEALALLASGAAGGALFSLLREHDTEPGLAVSLAVGFTVSPPLLVVLLRNGRSMDAAAILIITVGCLFIVRRQRVALALTLLVGTVVHESCLFLIPLAYAVWADRLFDAQALRDLAMVAAAPAIVYVYLRASIVARGENFQPGYTGPFFTERLDVIRTALRGDTWEIELRRVAIAFGPLWLVAPFGVPRQRLTSRGLVLVALCVVSMTFALDWGRAIFFAAPVVYVAAASILRDRRRLALVVVLALALVDFGYAGYMQFHGVKHGLDTTARPARGPVY